jgi:hypothetical protein
MQPLLRWWWCRTRHVTAGARVEGMRPAPGRGPSGRSDPHRAQCFGRHHAVRYAAQSGLQRDRHVRPHPPCSAVSSTPVPREACDDTQLASFCQNGPQRNPKSPTAGQQQGLWVRSAKMVTCPNAGSGRPRPTSFESDVNGPCAPAFLNSSATCRIAHSRSDTSSFTKAGPTLAALLWELGFRSVLV